MARLKRVFIPGVPSHVMVRGNDKQDIFGGDGDRRIFLDWLRDASQRHSVAIHAYVLMTNHVHLLATGERRESIAKTVQSLGRRYVAFFNQKYKRTGTLWEGRYKGALVQTQRYLLDCQRYIELNPVRAGMVNQPLDFRWSSHRHHSVGVADPLITTHPQILAMGGPEEWRAAYRRIFSEPLSRECLDRIRDATEHGWGIGDDEFIDSVSQQSGRRMARAGVGGRPRKKTGV